MLKVEEGNLREVKAARQKSQKEDVNFQNKAGQSALTIAARCGFCEIAEYLIMEGANVDILNKVLRRQNSRFLIDLGWTISFVFSLLV